MPFGSEGLAPGIGLALSGGGFRATLFHLGSLWRLNEFGILPRLVRVSSVSGGSITAALLARRWTEVTQDVSGQAFVRQVVEPLREFCRQHVDSVAISEGLFTPWRSSGEAIEEAYQRFLGVETLANLPDTPIFIFNATNLQTGRSFRFSKPYMGDYRIGLIRHPSVTLAKCVAASSAFPPFLSPVMLDSPGVFEPTEGADLNANPTFTQHLYLSDGGVYDNLGLETLWNRCQTVLVSDAGAPFSIGDVVQTDWVKQSLRALDVATDQARALRKRALVGDFNSKNSKGRSGAYWGIDTAITAYALADPLPCNRQTVTQLAAIRTRLNPFGDQEQEQLINWGYALCDAAIRTHAPQLVTRSSKPNWPCPKYALS